MKRREFMGLVGGAAAWPFAARGQQGLPLRRIGAFIPGNETASTAFERALREGLETRGWVEGRTLAIAQRRVRGGIELLREDAASLLAFAPEVIVAGSTQVVAVLKEATGTVPIVFVHIADPLAAGLVQSLARPGGNLTGFAAWESSIGSKWIELLKEFAPAVKRVLVLAGQNPTWRMHVPAMQAAAPTLGVEVTVSHVKSPAEAEIAMQAFAAKSDGGMIVLPDNMLDERREDIFALSAQYRLPDVYGSGSVMQQLSRGGLLSYSSDWVDLYRRAAGYVDLILKGAKPADLPVQQPTRFQLTVNLKTARALGLAAPPALLARADQVFE